MATFEPLVILGGGMTGLAAGNASGGLVLEASSTPGGICSSYYMGSDGRRLDQRCEDRECYRFELGGGHWIFGGDPLVLELLHRRTAMIACDRRSSIFLPEMQQVIAYPLQNHLSQLDPALATRALTEIVTGGDTKHIGQVVTMQEWIRRSFGDTLSDLFFEPFHAHYTAGLWNKIAPQDPYKSPLSVEHVVLGAMGRAPTVGYNATFRYPSDGLDDLARQLASPCRVEYGAKVISIDTDSRLVTCDDGSTLRYGSLLSTVPLDEAMRMAGIQLDSMPDPATSVLVVNIGAKRGTSCPTDHWVYVPKSKSGFHRVGFYSNVDSSFLPKARDARDYVSIYVEHAFCRDEPLSQREIQQKMKATVTELREWQWIEEAEVVDPTVVSTAYTWSWPNSRWASEAINALRLQGVLQIGRYGRWVFQGIADSLRDGFMAGATAKLMTSSPSK